MLFFVRKIIITILLFLIIISGLSLLVSSYSSNQDSISGAPPYGESEESAPELDFFSWVSNWKRPDGPPKVALQVGHYLNDNLPDELEKLRDSDGATGGGKSEWEVNLAIAEEAKKLLEEEGIVVGILPATVPASYWADVFIAIHADGSEDRTKRGFKIAPPWRDFTANAQKLVDDLYDSYSEATGFEEDENITVNMRGYYAFSWWRYEHAIHPMTTAVIVETGFLTNPSDRRLLISSPEIPAQGIAGGVIKYLISTGLIN